MAVHVAAGALTQSPPVVVAAVVEVPLALMPVCKTAVLEVRAQQTPTRAVQSHVRVVEAVAQATLLLAAQALEARAVVAPVGLLGLRLREQQIQAAEAAVHPLVQPVVPAWLSSGSLSDVARCTLRFTTHREHPTIRDP